MPIVTELFLVENFAIHYQVILRELYLKLYAQVCNGPTECKNYEPVLSDTKRLLKCFYLLAD